MFDRTREDIAAVRERDPAARSAIEIFFLYPGVKAVRMHRRANWFYRHGMLFLARAISQRAVRKTGIEITSGRQARPQIVYRPRNRRGHRRNRGNRG